MIQMTEKWTKMCSLEKNGVTANASTNESLESGNRYCTEVRLPITNYLTQWTGSCHEELVMIRTHMLPIIKRSLYDMQVVNELIGIRDDFLKQHDAAKATAAKWAIVEEKNQLRSSHVDAKNRDVAREAELRKLADMVSKLVLDQLNIVWEANIRRFARATESVTLMHSSALKKEGRKKKKKNKHKIHTHYKVLSLWQELVTLAGGGSVIHSTEFNAHSDSARIDEKSNVERDENQNDEQSTDVSVVNVIQDKSFLDSAPTETQTFHSVDEPTDEKQTTSIDTETTTAQEHQQHEEVTTYETGQSHEHIPEDTSEEQKDITVQEADANIVSASSYNPFDYHEDNPKPETEPQTTNTENSEQPQTNAQADDNEAQNTTDGNEAIDVSFLER
ncbi:hypothetical protein RFI_33383 [Reticulomyxa filosa]|uniref:Uncharacterized protein n=1 Tax=Reticulomyxa filosa TaxID=46433 RepID=X6LQ48_RETFI|nr:hypothetical protein RFI_33383 [Reticulomyxa filosa]|eukprot:ETO04018.1 hypothetical protein RFI_33383 [Reticulomyxa filosa]